MKKFNKGRDQVKKRVFNKEDIVQFIKPNITWKDLTLPQTKLSQLKDICDQCRDILHISRELDTNHRLSHRKAVNILFLGKAAEDKIMTVEAIASELGRPIFRIDLSLVINKYISETEKDLKVILSMAENRTCILFFDEADALFGKRTEGSDVHDHKTNEKIACLLKKIEQHADLVIIAGNFKRKPDKEFFPRFRFVVEFE